MMTSAALVLLLLLCLALGHHRTWSNETQPERNALVFAERNRAYGAYQLREGYGARVGMAMLVALGIMGAAVGLFMLLPRTVPPDISLVPNPPDVKFDVARIFVLPPPPSPKPRAASAPAATRAEKDPKVRHYVQAVDSMALPPLPDLDTATFAATGPESGSGTGIGTDTATLGGNGTGMGNSNAVHYGFEVQEVPLFPGGHQALAEWVRNHLEFPPGFMGSDKVYVQFTIGLDGNVEDVKAVKGKQAAYRKAAERTVQRMPRWKPARMNGHEVRCRLTLPIKFEAR